MVFGLLGTNVGREFQSFAHVNLFQGRGIPLGWDSQISKGGNFAFLLQNNFKAPVRTKKFDAARQREGLDFYRKRIRWDATYGVESALGYYTYLGANIGARLGMIDFLNFSKGQNTILGYVDKNNEVTVLDENPVVQMPVWEVYLFANASPRLFARNVLIHGQHGVPSGYALDPKFMSSFVAEFEYGLTVSRTRKVTKDNSDNAQKELVSLDNFQVSVSIKQRTAEIQYPTFIRTHSWGIVTLAFPFK
ncbi:hypothetical protein GCM10007390_19610 [Persicitalea jodogahamensis]|uniref:Uncharacterized protein n=2 Tax=Persicitalea jodogahamensis TaxID=402147 RepID=A0A8J3D837_9BACT|nr:hypothetical protein GCM10007390_19610 [Persicitalea jodogahamensis]